MRRLALAAVLALSLSLPADSHSWYPMECCHESDCAPADKVERYEPWKGAWMTSKHGTVWVPDSFEAHHRINPDSKEKTYTTPPPTEAQGLHVCMRPGTTWGSDTGHQKDPLKPMRLLCVIRESGI